MKKISFLSIIAIIILSMACSLPFLGEDEEPIAPTIETNVEPTQVVEIAPTNTVYVPPTAMPTSNELATQTPESQSTRVPMKIQTEAETESAACPPYGVEEFSSPNDCWPNTLDTIFSVATVSDWNKLFVGVVDDRLEFSTKMAEDIFMYSFYEENQYDEVILRASVSKIEPSTNANGFTLACHVNEDGWYEVRIASNGLFEINQYEQLKKQQGGNPYFKISNGGAPNFKTSEGNENIIEWQCGYNYLRFIVNEKQVWEKTGISNLNSGGGVGVGLASYSGTAPRHIGFEWVEILEP